VVFRRLAFALNPKHINGRPAKYPGRLSCILDRIEMDFKFCFCLLKGPIILAPQLK
jgi:hypothetical protein